MNRIQGTCMAIGGATVRWTPQKRYSHAFIDSQTHVPSRRLNLRCILHWDTKRFEPVREQPPVSKAFGLNHPATRVCTIGTICSSRWFSIMCDGEPSGTNRIYTSGITRWEQDNMQAGYPEGWGQGHTSSHKSKLLYSCHKSLMSRATHREVLFPHTIGVSESPWLSRSPLLLSVSWHFLTLTSAPDAQTGHPQKLRVTYVHRRAQDNGNCPQIKLYHDIS